MTWHRTSDAPSVSASGSAKYGEWVDTTAALVPALERAFAAADSGKVAVVNVKLSESAFRSQAISV